MSQAASLFSESPVLVLILLLCYFIGNISPAILIGRLSGVDIRKEGSGNAGTTNVLRVLGKKAAAATLVIDILKGVSGVLIGGWFGGEILALLGGIAAFLGHIWPVVFGFRGGKGIATGLGVLITFSPPIGLTCLAVALVAIILSKRVSVGSVLAALVLPFAAYYFVPDLWPFFAALTLIVLFKHRGNIKRILKGEEPKLNFKK